MLIDLIVDIAGTTPALARYLSRNAGVLDAVIGGSFWAPWPGVAQLRAGLAAALIDVPDYERKLDAALELRDKRLVFVEQGLPLPTGNALHHLVDFLVRRSKLIQQGGVADSVGSEPPSSANGR